MKLTDKEYNVNLFYYTCKILRVRVNSPSQELDFTDDVRASHVLSWAPFAQI